MSAAVQHNCVNPQFRVHKSVFCFVLVCFWVVVFFRSPLCQQGSVKFGQLTLQTRSSRPVSLSSKPPQSAGGRQNNPKK